MVAEEGIVAVVAGDGVVANATPNLLGCCGRHEHQLTQLGDIPHHAGLVREADLLNVVGVGAIEESVDGDAVGGAVDAEHEAGAQATSQHVG